MGNFPTGDYFCYLTYVCIHFIFSSTCSKLKFKSYLGFEFIEFKVPFFHLFFVSDGLPYFFNRCVVSLFNYKWFLFHLRLFFLCLSSSRNFPKAPNLPVQNSRYCSIQSETSFSCFSCASQYLSRPCCLITIRPHSVSIFICLDTAGLLISK